MDFKLIITIIATLLVFVGYTPYIIDTYRGKTRPHIFSYFLWSLLVFIVFFLQFTHGGGYAVWHTFTVFLFLFFIFILSFKKGKRDIRKIDYVFFFFALLSIPIWLIADQAEVSITILVVINIFAFLMTLRKIWIDPWSETLILYIVTAIRYSIILFAFADLNYITFISPFVAASLNALTACLIFIRRKQIQLKK